MKRILVISAASLQPNRNIPATPFVSKCRLTLHNRLEVRVLFSLSFPLLLRFVSSSALAEHSSSGRVGGEKIWYFFLSKALHFSTSTVYRADESVSCVTFSSAFEFSPSVSCYQALPSLNSRGAQRKTRLIPELARFTKVAILNFSW